MKKFALVLSLLLISAPLAAQTVDPPATPQADEAKIVLVAPDSARVGELIRFDVTQSVADSFEWLLVPQTAMTDFEVYDAGSRAVFSARMEGEYVFIIAAARAGTVDVIRHVIRIKGPPPMPSTDAIDEWIPFWAYAYNLPSPGAQLLAESFEEIAARDGLEAPEDWIKATAESNRAKLGDKLTIYKPILDKIGEILLKRAQEGLLITPEQHKALWLEIASGLRKI